jgi:hypothetical protein
MAVLLVDKNRDFRRFRHTAKEKLTLAKNRFIHVLSSNVSAVKRDGKALLIRFHNGSIYTYPTSGHLIVAMLKSNSKGRFVWRKLIRPGVPYFKSGTLKLKRDSDVSDKEVFGIINTLTKRAITKNVLTAAILRKETTLSKQLALLRVLQKSTV